MMLRLDPFFFNYAAQDASRSNRTSQLHQTEGSAMQIAIGKALQAFETYFPMASIIEIEIEYSRSEKGFIVEVEGVDENDEYKLKLAVDSGELIKREIKRLNEFRSGGVALRREVADLSHAQKLFDEIYDIAQEQVSFSHDEIREIEFSREGNYHEWEFELKIDGQEVEIEIDAETGQVLEVEYD